MTRIWLFFAVSVLIFSACVPAKKLVYLQKEDELKNRKSIPKDSILRTHTLNIRENRIQPLDLLSVNFETLGNENDAFDFLSKISPQGMGGGNVSSLAVSGVLVNKEGEIEYAVLGKIKVAGLTIFEAEDTIQAVASRYMADVVVRVRMLNFRFTVLGEVNAENIVTSSNTRVTMMEAIGLAGGFNELADRSTVKVVRQNGLSVDVFYVDLLKEDFVESPFFYIQQNDIIIVPPIKQRTFRKYFIGNLSIITSAITFAALIITIFDN